MLQDGRNKSIMDVISALLWADAGGFLGCFPFTETLGFHFIRLTLNPSQILESADGDVEGIGINWN